mmetsp:Transcript_24443/g.78874  ORF Transcript_24443/g.78874 Transcript_24443/m.78874 type:complete len:246 (-) Transcript_24443:325-1062(-)
MSRRAILQAARVCRIPGNKGRPNPTLFQYPGLNSRPWYAPESSAAFEWVRRLEAATADITAEYQALRAGGLPPSDYEASESDHGSDLHQGRESWHWASFIDRGVRRPQMAERCPITRAVLDATPRLCVDAMPFAFAFFSTLRGGSRIAPHCAPCNLRVRVHLPLIIPNPDACGITVAGETRRWEVGKALVFDDAYEHEVWNDGEEDRVVLLFDTWHPDLTDDEVQAIQAMFSEVEGMRSDRRTRR